MTSMHPVGSRFAITQRYEGTFSSDLVKAGTKHGAVDFATPIGTPIVAADDGAVTFAGRDYDLPGDDSIAGWTQRHWQLKPAPGQDRAGGGKLIFLTNPVGSTWIHAHCSEIAVKPGQRVKRGDFLGLTGDTGLTFGPHLHFGLVPAYPQVDNGAYGAIDPLPWLTIPYRMNGEPPTLTKGPAMIFLTELADVLRRAGLTVIEVPGWKTRGYAGWGFYGNPRGVLHHHTATGSARWAGVGSPTLNLLTNGRSDLAGPLCNLAFGRGGEVYVVAAGWANHAGVGGPQGLVPRDQGNGWMIGIEAESSGVAPVDWTPDQYRVWPYLAAALERQYLLDQQPIDRVQAAHYEWSSMGKIDPALLPGAIGGLRSATNYVLEKGTHAWGPKNPTGAPTASAIKKATKPAPAVAAPQKEWSDMATKNEILGGVEDLLLKHVRGTINDMVPGIVKRELDKARAEHDPIIDPVGLAKGSMKTSVDKSWNRHFRVLVEDRLNQLAASLAVGLSADRLKGLIREVLNEDVIAGADTTQIRVHQGSTATPKEDTR